MLPKWPLFGTGTRGHYERGLFTGGVSGISKISKLSRIILVSVKMFVRNSGAGNGCANFMGAWKNAFFLQENPCP